MVEKNRDKSEIPFGQLWKGDLNFRKDASEYHQESILYKNAQELICKNKK